MVWGIFIMLTVGWMPESSFSTPLDPRSTEARMRITSHSCEFFAKDYWLIVQSDAAFFTVLSAVIYASYKFGFGTVAFYYLLPLSITNLCLVLITYLQHTATYLPHFRGKEWTFPTWCALYRRPLVRCCAKPRVPSHYRYTRVSSYLQ